MDVAFKGQKDSVQAFGQLCNFIAVDRLASEVETVGEIICLALVLAPNAVASSSEDLRNLVRATVGLDIPEHELMEPLSTLLRADRLWKDENQGYRVEEAFANNLKKRLGESHATQKRVRARWAEALATEHPRLDPDAMWRALESYLTRSLRLHGMQTVSLLDASSGIHAPAQTNIRTLLTQSVNENVHGVERHEAEDAIEQLLQSVVEDQDLRTFVTSLADTAFNFYSLKVSPEVTAQLRRGMAPITLFLDTNFLFGILGLHDNTQVSISNKLIDVINELELPITLTYHEITEREVRDTLVNYQEKLRSRSWSQGLSAAAVRFGNLVGIELKYHEQNAKTPTDPADFFAKYFHFQELLATRGIQAYMPSSGRLEERADLYQAYKVFLATESAREKSYATVAHDATLLDAVRSMRTDSVSSLEAGCLLVTCDFSLYRFDQVQLRRGRARGTVVLPNMLWQMLKPFIGKNDDFDLAFAEALAIPELRVLSGKAVRAASVMLGIMATWKDVPEDAALHMLTDDALSARLRKSEDTEEMAELIAQEFVAYNARLAEANASLKMQLSRTSGRTAEAQLVARESEERATGAEEQNVELRRQLKDMAVELEELKAALLEDTTEPPPQPDADEQQRFEPASSLLDRLLKMIERNPVYRLAAVMVVVGTAIAIGIPACRATDAGLRKHYSPAPTATLDVNEIKVTSREAAAGGDRLTVVVRGSSEPAELVSGRSLVAAYRFPSGSWQWMTACGSTKPVVLDGSLMTNRWDNSGNAICPAGFKGDFQLMLMLVPKGSETEALSWASTLSEGAPRGLAHSDSISLLRVVPSLAGLSAK